MSKITQSFNSAWQQVLEYCKKSPWKERFEDHCENYLELYYEELKLSREEFLRKAQNFEQILWGNFLV